MKRYIHTLIVVLIFNIIPLAGKPELIVHFKNIIIIVANILVWLTQPTFNAEETKANQSKDKNSIFLIVGMLFPSLLIPILIWAYTYTEQQQNTLSISGIILIVTGIIFRIWSIYTLGKNFTAAVMFKEKHQLITTGPYRFLRHPSYTGAFFAIIGCAFLLETYLGALIAAACMFTAYYFRITAEEKALVDFFGNDYKELQKRTYKMIPFIW
jgi:protein-S-isoprenylcysteine O-methyltransferase Ste14